MKIFQFLKKVKSLSIKTKIISGVLSIVTIGIVTTGTVLVINNYQKGSKEENCMVLFDTSGGTSVFSREVKCGNKIEVSDIPTKTGFDFKHWSYEGQQIIWENFVIEKSITVYAEWEKQEDTEVVYVEFDSNGGSKTETIAAAKGSAIIPPLSPVKEGYEFVEWRHNGKLFDFGTKINESIKLTAEWKKIVKPNNNGNSNNSNNNNATNNSSKKYKCISTISNNVPEKTVYVGYSEHFNWAFSADITYSLEDCSISFKSSNSSVASVSDDGKIKALSHGTAYLYQCINDKETKEEIGCFKGNLTVNKTDDMIKQEKVLEFANSVNGYYWYLDGYEYAYIYTEIVDEYGETALKWTSKHLKIDNNKFITAEDENKTIYNSGIGVLFDMKPLEFSYDVVLKYKMRVSNSKLYITLGDKEYSFTKRTSEKKEGTVTFSISQQNITINEYEQIELNLNVNNSFFNHEFEFISSNNSIAGCLFNIYCSGPQCKFSCSGVSPGNATVTLRDKVGNYSQTINFKVNDVYYPVTGVTLNATNVKMYKGDTKWLDATVQPSTADNKYLTWSSSDPSVVSVDASGVLTAKNKGEAIITVKTTDGGHIATCNVVVDYPPLTAEANVKTEYACVNNECGTYNKVEIKVKGGNEQYYYSYKVYLNEQYIDTYTYKTTYLPALFGTYRIEFEVKDTKEHEYTGVSTVVINQ